MGRMQRTKGASYEREIANTLKPLWPEAKRGIGQSRSAKEVCDVEGTPFWLELKAHKVPNIRAAMKQAMEDTDGRPPVVISKANGEGTLVTMRLEDFLRMCKHPEGCPCCEHVYQ